MRFRLTTQPYLIDLPRSLLVALVFAATFWSAFVLFLVSFATDPQTPIGLMLSPVYAVYVGSLAGTIHVSAGAMRRGGKMWIAAFAFFLTASVLLLVFAWWIARECAEAIGR